MDKKSFRFEILENPEDLTRLKAGWESLCDECANYVTVFSSHAWYQSWWKCYSADAKLQLFTMWQGDKLVGIAPLMWEKSSFHGLPVRVVGFIQNNQSLHNDFIVMPQFRTLFLQKLLGSVFKQSSQWDSLYFRNISSISDNYKSLVQVLDDQDRKWGKKATPFDTPYFIPSGSWSDYLDGRSRRTRKTIKNIRNRIRKAGKVSVRHITTLEEFLSCKEDLLKVAQQSWTEKGGDALGSAPNKCFFESLSMSAAAKGWLSIWALYLDDKMIAIESHLKAYGREHALLGHYHSQFASLSPGAYLEMTILKHIFEEHERVQLYDFCGSFDNYKKKWTSTYVPHSDIFVFNDKIYSKTIMFNEFKLVPFLRETLRSAKLLR